MELWNMVAVEKSEKILNELKKYGDFVLIGGWAVYFWTKAVKSLDIDIYINFKDFYALQGYLAEKGFFVSFNPKLKKYSAKIEEIEIDIYTPEHCSLLIPCKDVFSNNWFEIIEGFKVIKPEPLLFLKLSAEEKRAGTFKGFKDRCDILALLNTDIDRKLLEKLFLEYNHKLKERLIKIIRQSSKEYEYAFQKKLNLKEIKKIKLKILKVIE